MADQKITVNLTLGYKNTKETRTYTIDDVARDDLQYIEEKVDAINASIKAGTDDGLSAFFRSDDYDESTDTGTMVGIIEAESVIVEEELIYKRGA